jgi:uncharacterized glyoxalase superfamily protein PhnB
LALPSSPWASLGSVSSYSQGLPFWPSASPQRSANAEEAVDDADAQHVVAANLKPFIPSGEDFAKARQFFLDLGFSVNWEKEGYAELQLGSAVFILQDFHTQTMQENLMMQAEVDDLDAWWNRIRVSGVLERYRGVRAREPTEYPWGNREVHLIDPAGVCWHFV